MPSQSLVRVRRQPRQGLRSRMAGVLKELRRVRKSADADSVHDLRVAIRRCRSVATVMEEVDGHQTWGAMKRLPRKLFRALGALRDLHVLEAWVKRLVPGDDPLRDRFLEVLEDREAAPREQVRRAIRTFDREGWERLARTATARARLVPPNSLTAQCLALERYEDLYRLHARAVRTERPAAWHALRVGLKRFRYTVENLLPERSAVWEESLGQIQTVLGELHDLDVLRSRITGESDGIATASARSLGHTIATKRRACIAQYRQRMSGESSLLGEWRAGLPHGTAIESGTAARLRTTARAMDPHPNRTVATSRLALLLFDGLAASGAERRFRDGRLRSVLGAAAQLHAIDVPGRRTARHKAARDFLRAVPAPPGWKAQEWDLLTEIVRYHRGPEPAARPKRFAQLARKRRDCVRGLAGVLRLARGLRRCGVSVAGGVRIDLTAAYVRLRVSGVQDTEDHAARLAAAKHLLERHLRRTVLIESPGVAESIRAPRKVDGPSPFDPKVAADSSGSRKNRRRVHNPRAETAWVRHTTGV
jgi:CHAD domain-containing protein